MSRVAGTAYTIGSPTRRCAATGRELATGEPFVAVLVQAPDADEFERLDFCADAWSRGSRPPRPLLVFGHWRGVVPEPGARKKLLVDDQSLLELFEASAEDTSLIDATSDAPAAPAAGPAAPSEKDRLAFRFVLALILLRKRLLFQEGQKGTSLMVRPKGAPRPPEGPPLIEVIDPGLDDDTVVRVTQRLGAVLSGDAPAAPQHAGGPPAPANATKERRTT